MTARRGPFFLPRAAAVTRGWTLEAVLGVGALVAVHLGDALLGPDGGVLLVVALGIGLSWCAPVRHRLAELLAAGSTRRWLARALRRCGVEGPCGATPRIVDLRGVPVGQQLRVQLPLGYHAGHLERQRAGLASQLRVREVRVLRDPADASLAEVVVVARDVLGAGAPLGWPWAGRPRTLPWEPVPLGLSEDGGAVTLPLVEHHLLLGGEPGAGKSVALSLLVAAAALDPGVRLHLLDAKQVELAPFAGAAGHFVGPDVEVAVDVLEDLRKEMDARYEALLSSGRRKVARDDGPCSLTWAYMWAARVSIPAPWD